MNSTFAWALLRHVPSTSPEHLLYDSQLKRGKIESALVPAVTIHGMSIAPISKIGKLPNTDRSEPVQIRKDLVWELGSCLLLTETYDCEAKIGTARERVEDDAGISMRVGAFGASVSQADVAQEWIVASLAAA